MTRYIIESDINLHVKELLEIYLNWKKNQDTFSIYCEDRKLIESTIQLLKDFGIFPRIIEINKNQQYIDIYIHLMQITQAIESIEPMLIYYILDRIYRLKPAINFIPVSATYHLLDRSIEWVKEMNMTIAELYDEYNLDSLLVRIDERDVIVDPIVISLDNKYKNTDMQKISKILISKNNLINGRALFILDGLSGIKIQYSPNEPYGELLNASWKKFKKKKTYRSIDWIASDDVIIIQDDLIRFAIPNKNQRYVEVFRKIYRIKNNKVYYLFDAV